MNSAATTGRPGRAAFPGGLLVLGAAAILLLAGLAGFEQTRRAIPQARADLARAESALAEARLRERLAQQNALLLKAATALQQRAQGMAVSSGFWSERRMNLHQQHLTREEINPLLTTMGRSRSQMLLPETFELSVTKADEGLFQAPDSLAQRMVFSLRGTVLFRISERPQ